MWTVASFGGGFTENVGCGFSLTRFHLVGGGGSPGQHSGEGHDSLKVRLHGGTEHAQLCAFLSSSPCRQSAPDKGLH